MKIGYTQGTYDLFHRGHLNLLERAKEQCDYLIVGINSDDLVEKYKNKTPIYSQEDRMKIVSALKVVDEVILCNTLDKKEILKEHKYDLIFIGDDWKGTDRWNKTEQELNKLGINVVYLSYTKGISSTFVRKQIEQRIEKKIKEKMEHVDEREAR